MAENTINEYKGLSFDEIWCEIRKNFDATYRQGFSDGEKNMAENILSLLGSIDPEVYIKNGVFSTVELVGDIREHIFGKIEVD